VPALKRQQKNNPYEGIAAKLYEKRMEDDAIAGKGTVHSPRNPDARALYFKGVNDVLQCLRVWLNEAPTPDLPIILHELEEQSKTEADNHD